MEIVDINGSLNCIIVHIYVIPPSLYVGYTLKHLTESEVYKFFPELRVNDCSPHFRLSLNPLLVSFVSLLHNCLVEGIRNEADKYKHKYKYNVQNLFKEGQISWKYSNVYLNLRLVYHTTIAL